jgi:hypothetical protein
MPVGSATLDFGAAPGSSEASVAVTGQAAIVGSSVVEAFIMADDTTVEHTAADHRYLAAMLGITCGAVSAGVGFTIFGRALDKIEGRVAVRWVWT